MSSILLSSTMYPTASACKAEKVKDEEMREWRGQEELQDGGTQAPKQHRGDRWAAALNRRIAIAVLIWDRAVHGLFQSPGAQLLALPAVHARLTTNPSYLQVA
ncbi:hypothetical protein FOZG_07845 [Fusarium oxysporum Fo47]|uniref:Uncharacterized protein n=1 Tax=Fusarium oxysporum Fo47 TaxID=660027 RepID=W9KFF4_FUSOX|nr:hypothetical protein FOZG_07845 [Fusarium oxysporum Fo47]